VVAVSSTLENTMLFVLPFVLARFVFDAASRNEYFTPSAPISVTFDKSKFCNFY